LIMTAKASVIAGLLLLSMQPALGMCPAPVPGTNAEEIRADRSRILCLQGELSQEAERRKIQMDLDALTRQIQDMQLQRQLDALPKFEPPPVWAPR
jgi:hypothetical protein